MLPSRAEPVFSALPLLFCASFHLCQDLVSAIAATPGPGALDLDSSPIFSLRFLRERATLVYANAV